MSGEQERALVPNCGFVETWRPYAAPPPPPLLREQH